MTVISPEVKQDVSNINDFLPIEDTYLPHDLVYLGSLTRFVVYTLAAPAGFDKENFNSKAMRDKKPVAVEYQSKQRLKYCDPSAWMSFQAAVQTAATVPGGNVGFLYKEEAFIPQHVWDEFSLPFELHQAALEGAHILPLAPADKKPLVQWIYGERPATSDLNQLKKWAINFPRCNWAERQGVISGKVAVDNDSQEGEKYIRDNGGFPVTLTIKSGNPDPCRKHYDFKLPAGMKIKCSSTKKRIAPGIDIKGENGYVVIPPSLHKSGERYRVEVQAERAELPQWFIDALRAAGLIVDAHSPEKERTKPAQGYSELDDRDREHGLNILRAEIVETLKVCDQFTIEDAPWNDHLNLLAGTAGNLSEAGCFDEEFAKCMVEEYCSAYVEDNRSGFEATWRSGFTHGSKSPWVPLGPEVFGIPGSAPLPAGAIPPEVWEKQQQTQSRNIAEKLATERAAEPKPEAAPEQRTHTWQFPEGLVGDVARFIYKSAYKPNQEVALAGAIAFLAGIAGRQYNTSTGTGLNQYIIALAETSRGKEGAATGIGKLRRAINLIDLTLMKQFVGPGSIASAPALKKRLSGSACFYSFMGEIGKTLQKMTARNANPNDIDLMGCLMDAFMKSGRDSSMPGSDYASKENIPDIDSPCATVIGDSTPGDFYKAMTLGDFSSGLIPRFTIIEHVGLIPPSNKHHKGVIPPPELVQRLVKLIRNVIKLQPGHKVIEVDMTPEAQLFAEKFEYDYERKQEQNAGPIAELWSRSNLRMLRLASLVAVGALPWHDEQADFSCVVPTVTLPMVKWAADLIVRSNEIVEQRVTNGGIGQTGEADEQRRAIENCICRFIKGNYKASWEKSYGITEEMHSLGHISFRFIRNATVNKKCFATQEYGRAAKGILQNLVDAEYIKPLNVTNATNGAVSQQFQVVTTEGLHEGD
jgi:hypothetical protein